MWQITGFWRTRKDFEPICCSLLYDSVCVWISYITRVKLSIVSYLTLFRVSWNWGLGAFIIWFRTSVWKNSCAVHAKGVCLFIYLSISLLMISSDSFHGWRLEQTFCNSVHYAFSFWVRTVQIFFLPRWISWCNLELE